MVARNGHGRDEAAHYYDLNVVRVKSDPDMDTADLIAFADEALAGLEHRRIDFEDAVIGALDLAHPGGRPAAAARALERLGERYRA